MTKPTQQPIYVRMPLDVKDWLAGQVGLYGCLVNSEIIRAVRERMERDHIKKAPSVPAD